MTSVPRHDVSDVSGSSPRSPEVRPSPPRVEWRCPDCAARNAPGAAWCGQCLRRFTDAPAPAGAEGVPAPRGGGRREETAGLEPDASSVFEVEGGEVTWRCPVCDSRNALEASVCSVCGAKLAAALRPPESRGPERDPGTTALLSLFLPGAGHAYLGLWGQAAARAVTSIWVISVALMFAAAQGPAAPIPLLFEALAFGLWCVAAHDAYREAAGDVASVILRGRTFMFTFLCLVGLSVVAVFVSAFAAIGPKG